MIKITSRTYLNNLIVKTRTKRRTLGSHGAGAVCVNMFYLCDRSLSYFLEGYPRRLRARIVVLPHAAIFQLKPSACSAHCANEKICLLVGTQYVTQRDGPITNEPALLYFQLQIDAIQLQLGL